MSDFCSSLNYLLLRRFLKILRNTFFILIGLIAVLVVLVNLTPVQNWMARQAASMLSKKLKTKVSVAHVRIDLLDHLVIQGLYIEDHQHDTLLYAGEAIVNITDWFIFKDEKPVISHLELNNTYAHLYRTASGKDWNYQFVVDAFDTGPRDKTKKKNEFELDLKDLALRNVRVHMDDAWAGKDYDVDIGTAALKGKELDLKKRLIDLSTLTISNSLISCRDYAGGKPKDTAHRVKTIDTSRFNPGWVLRLASANFNNCRFVYETTHKPWAAGSFDPGHMDISSIDMSASDLSITGDTLHGKLKNISGLERCGFVLEEASGDVTVSPVMSEVKNLKIKTPHSTLGNYYAMHYDRFPDFEDYIHKVRMDARLQNSIVDSRDVAFFAPQLRQYPTVVKASGRARGTVDNIEGDDLDITDGSSGIKGSLSFVGLPDIDKTFITLTGGEIFTSGDAILRYAPELRNDPSIDIKQLQYLYYQGNFAGTIYQFTATGNLVTNLGNVHSDVRMILPPGATLENAQYAGTVSTSGFDIGRLFRQPDLGMVAINATISGQGFTSALSGLKMNATIPMIDLYGYRYHNISTDGVLSGKKFTGELLVNDSNLSMAFNGILDLSGDVPAINATANVLHSDLQQLHLSKEPIGLVADFDLNVRGKNLDDFLGTANLHNINLTRMGQRIEIDSVYLVSELQPGDAKLLTLTSNDFTASITGQYQLSTLPVSAAYFLYRYAPNYIHPPDGDAPDQNITFNIVTRQIGHLLSILSPDITGFSNSSLEGSLNTSKQQVQVEAHVPYGRIGNTDFSDVAIAADGNYQKITVLGDIENMTVGDSLLKLSVNVNSSLGNDSLRFKIRSASNDAFGTATLNGGAIARGDSIYFALQPSEFYLNKARWEIPDGAVGVVARRYLKLHNLLLKSSDQALTINSADEQTTQSLLVDVSKLDLHTVSDMLNMGDIKPGGIFNGNLRIDHLYDALTITAKLNGDRVTLGTDTLGSAVIGGTYETKGKTLTLDPETGIYGKDGWINAKGSFVFDSSGHKMDGTILLSQAPLAWVSSFTTGLFSQFKGTLDGDIKFSGTAAHPIVTGNVAVNGGALRVDYLGVNYTIDPTTVQFDNRTISFDHLTLKDRYGNTAGVTGNITHNLFDDISFHLRGTSPKFEVMDLQSYENSNFYGHLIAEIDGMTVNGSLDDIRMSIQAAPAAESQLYLPVGTSSAPGSYNYVSFAKHGASVEEVVKKKSKVTITIDALANDMAEVFMILDPSTGDVIRARGDGTIKLEIPASGDVRIFGSYNIDRGSYTFTFRQLFLSRTFIINSGSRISFSGPIEQTDLNVNATYLTRASLYDLLTEKEKANNFIMDDRERTDAKRLQDVNVLLTMTGNLERPDLSFRLDLPEKRSVGTYAYTKLSRINQSDRELFDQVASLLLIGYFIPPEGIETSSATSGAINNISEILSTTTSTQLTNIVNKVLGDPKISINFRYKNYNLSDGSSLNPINRNEIKLGFSRNFFNDKLIVELGTAYDWGRPSATNSNTSNFNPVGDFRAQYLLNQAGSLRLNAFNVSSYDALVDKNISRRGFGISWRKSFDSLPEFFRGKRKNSNTDQIQAAPTKDSTVVMIGPIQ